MKPGVGYAQLFKTLRWVQKGLMALLPSEGEPRHGAQFEQVR